MEAPWVGWYDGWGLLAQEMGGRVTVSPGKMRSGLPERRPPRFSWMSSFQYGAIRPLDRVTPPSARWLAAMVQRLSPRWTVYRSGRPGGAAPSLRAELSGTGATGGTWAAGGMDATGGMGTGSGSGEGWGCVPGVVPRGSGMP